MKLVRFRYPTLFSTLFRPQTVVFCDATSLITNWPRLADCSAYWSIRQLGLSVNGKGLADGTGPSANGP